MSHPESQLFVPTTPPHELYGYLTGGSDGGGWNFDCGDPEAFQLSDRLIKPGGTVLDIGSGAVRASMIYAMNGMNVTALDCNGEALDWVDDMAAQHALPIRTVYSDFLEDPLPAGLFDVVVLAQSLIHIPSKQDGFDLIKRAYDSTADGGHLWIRANGKDDSHYDDVRREGQEIAEDTFEVLCGCSGELGYDPVTFFNQLEIPVLLATLGALPIYTRVIPQLGRANMMYGEDFNSHIHYQKSGTVTVLVQKPDSTS